MAIANFSKLLLYSGYLWLGWILNWKWGIFIAGSFDRSEACIFFSSGLGFSCSLVQASVFLLSGSRFSHSNICFLVSSFCFPVSGFWDPHPGFWFPRSDLRFFSLKSQASSFESLFYPLGILILSSWFPVSSFKCLFLRPGCKVFRIIHQSFRGACRFSKMECANFQTKGWLFWPKKANFSLARAVAKPKKGWFCHTIQSCFEKANFSWKKRNFS